MRQNAISKRELIKIGLVFISLKRVELKFPRERQKRHLESKGKTKRKKQVARLHLSKVRNAHGRADGKRIDSRSCCNSCVDEEKLSSSPLIQICHQVILESLLKSSPNSQQDPTNKVKAQSLFGRHSISIFWPKNAIRFLHRQFVRSLPPHS